MLVLRPCRTGEKERSWLIVEPGLSAGQRVAGRA